MPTKGIGRCNKKKTVLNRFSAVKWVVVIILTKCAFTKSIIKYVNRYLYYIC